MNSSEYLLKLEGKDVRYAVYRPLTSELFWQDTQQKLDLRPVGIHYSSAGGREGKPWIPAFPVSPSNPGAKSRSLRSIKIQLGLKCNYSCKYCNQGGERAQSKSQGSDVDSFMNLLPSWFDGGEDGLGKGVAFEFWGGEPLVYWKTLRPLAEQIRSKYPQARFNIITNASLLNDEIIDQLDRLNFGVGISHDGEQYANVRGIDPLTQPEKKRMIRKLFDRLAPQNRIGFNCVITRENRSLAKIRSYIADKLEVPENQVSLTTEEILLPYDSSGLQLSPQSDFDYYSLMQQTYWEAVTGQSMPVSTLHQKMRLFFKSIAEGRPAFSLGQKCGMDRSDTIAVDLKGNALTCQNTSADTKHKIGHIQDFDQIRLTTAHHWSTRRECVRCPVLQLCQGACLFLENKLWEKACDNSFYWNLAVLAASMYWMTGLVLTEIQGTSLRRDDLPNRIPVIDPRQMHLYSDKRHRYTEVNTASI